MGAFYVHDVHSVHSVHDVHDVHGVHDIHSLYLYLNVPKKLFVFSFAFIYHNGIFYDMI